MRVTPHYMTLKLVSIAGASKGASFYLVLHTYEMF